MPGFNFSFSGIKTAFLYFLRDEKLKNPDFIEQNMADICASLQYHLVNMLMKQLIKASKEADIKTIAIAGGVAANSGLRNELKNKAAKLDWKVFIPEFQYCTDNAAMIAMVAHYKFLAGEFCSLDVAPEASLVI